jgi:hypothetical protein
MMFQGLTTVISLIILANVSSHPVCFVCGDEFHRISNFDAMVTLPGQDPVSCFSLDQAGVGSLIPKDACDTLPSYIEPCECTYTAGDAPVATVPPIPPSPVAPVPKDAGVVAAPIPPTSYVPPNIL